MVAFFFTDQIALMDLSKNLPFFFTTHQSDQNVLHSFSDRSDFAQNKPNEHLDKPHFHCCLFTFSQPIATWQTTRKFLLIYA